jgi:hypothetical protein
MRMSLAILVSLFVAASLVGQQIDPASGEVSQELTSKRRIETNATTANRLAKISVTDSQTVTDSIVTEVPGGPAIEVNGRVGIGGLYHGTARLRLSETAPGVPATGPYHLTFGNATSMYWGIRLDGSYDMHVDHFFSPGGWTEGLVLQRDGDVGIGVAAPEQTLHIVKDQNAGTTVQISNPNAGALAFTSFRMSEGGTAKGELKSASSGSATPNLMSLTNLANATLTLGTNNTERMRIFANGHVSIGFPSDVSDQDTRLSVFEFGSAVRAFMSVLDVPISANTTQSQIGSHLAARYRPVAGVTNSGYLTGTFIEALNYGAGTLSQAIGVRVQTGTGPEATGSTPLANGVRVDVMSGAGSVTEGRGLYITDVQATTGYGVYQEGANDTNYFAGSVAIGAPLPAGSTKKMYVVGDVEFVGSVVGTNIRANYQDVAEWVPSADDLSPATVVVLDKRTGNTVKASTGSYDTSVAGVVSAQPGIILGEEGVSKEQIATTGRVRVRVDASKAPIEIGDLLVTSDIPGTAMKSAPIDIGGFSIHRPGTIIGKALEPLDRGAGEILVLLSLQ